jgi:murein DD-endopeptidase MepM/ murein hydrolase activator NlpD
VPGTVRRRPLVRFGAGVAVAAIATTCAAAARPSAAAAHDAPATAFASSALSVTSAPAGVDAVRQAPEPEAGRGATRPPLEAPPATTTAPADTAAATQQTVEQAAATLAQRQAELDALAAAQAAQAKAAAAAKVAAAAFAYAHRWVRPNAGGISSPFGRRWGAFHAGVDLAGGYGSPILAATAGTVVYAGPESGYGEVVKIHDWDGTDTWYGHMEKTLVHAGEAVTPGQLIALVGARGDATGPHLHFEVHVGGVPVDPVPFLAAHGVRI